MNGKQHLKFYIVALIPFFIYLILNITLWYCYIPLALLSFVIIDPDDDLKIGIKSHRSAYTHSVIFILLIYFSLSIIPDANIPFTLVQTLCYPLLVHIAGDNKLRYKGSATLSFWPIKKRLTSDQTQTCMVINVGIIATILFYSNIIWGAVITTFLIIYGYGMNKKYERDRDNEREKNKRNK